VSFSRQFESRGWKESVVKSLSGQKFVYKWNEDRHLVFKRFNGELEHKRLQITPRKDNTGKGMRMRRLCVLCCIDCIKERNHAVRRGSLTEYQCKACNVALCTKCFRDFYFLPRLPPSQCCIASRGEPTYVFRTRKEVLEAEAQGKAPEDFTFNEEGFVRKLRSSSSFGSTRSNDASSEQPSAPQPSLLASQSSQGSANTSSLHLRCDTHLSFLQVLAPTHFHSNLPLPR